MKSWCHCQGWTAFACCVSNLFSMSFIQRISNRFACPTVLVGLRPIIVMLFNALPIVNFLSTTLWAMRGQSWTFITSKIPLIQDQTVLLRPRRIKCKEFGIILILNKNAKALTLHSVILLCFFLPSNLTTVNVSNTPSISMVLLGRSKSMSIAILSKVLHQIQSGRPFLMFW